MPQSRDVVKAFHPPDRPLHKNFGGADLAFQYHSSHTGRIVPGKPMEEGNGPILFFDVLIGIEGRLAEGKSCPKLSDNLQHAPILHQNGLDSCRHFEKGIEEFGNYGVDIGGVIDQLLV